MNTSSVAISIKNVSKEYKLYQSPAHRVKETFHPFRKKYNTTFQALRNISITINRGETVGIVGRNGCGKSTLLQIVCGIMPPTSGELQIYGRISAILELGAGFNPEFSGRSNVYLNCSILGMDVSGVDERIQDILEFADIGEFIDQPVKTYSSGMAIRLAFSIAINADPSVLVVDEALSVGDSAFQRKCFSRIKTIQEQGATILFVSHDAAAVVELCDRVMLIDKGELLFSGSPKKAVSLYHKLLFAPQDKVVKIRQEIIDKIEKDDEKKSSDVEQDTDDLPVKEQKPKEYYNEHLVPKSAIWYEPNGAKIYKPYVRTLDGRKVNVLVRNEEYYYTYDVRFFQNIFNVRFCMAIKTIRGFELGGYENQIEDVAGEYITEGSIVHVSLRFRCHLLPGTYFLNAGVRGISNKEDGYLHRGIDVAMFEVMQEGEIGSTAVVDFGIVPEVTFKVIGEN